MAPKGFKKSTGATRASNFTEKERSKNRSLGKTAISHRPQGILKRRFNHDEQPKSSVPLKLEHKKVTDAEFEHAANLIEMRHGNVNPSRHTLHELALLLRAPAARSAEDHERHDNEVNNEPTPEQRISQATLSFNAAPQSTSNITSTATGTFNSTIPVNALAMSQHFELNNPRPLGVQLPLNRAKTSWFWAPYLQDNGSFDWSSESRIRSLNRWRNQRISRELTKLGIAVDRRNKSFK